MQSTSQGQDTFIAPPQISFKPEHGPNFFAELESHGLVFQQTVSATEVDQCIWLQLYGALSKHANTHRFLLPMGSLPSLPQNPSSSFPSTSSVSTSTSNPPSALGSAPPLHESPWVIMKRKKTPSGAFSVYKLEANYNLYTPSLTFKWLSGTYPKEMRHPTWPGPMIVFGESRSCIFP